MKNIFIFLLLILFFAGCQYDYKPKQDKEIIGEEFIFPDNIEVLEEDTIFRTITYNNFINLYKHKPVIISIISGDCHVCTSRLKKWNSIIADKKFGDEMNYIFVISTTDKGYFARTFFEHYDYIPEFIIDNNDEFFKKNKFENISGNNTFLLDKNHIIKVRGNPVLYEEYFEIYMENIKQLQ
ncbi:MAG: hypothetical protein ACLFVR_00240 [Thiohalospira sp.]